MHGSIVNHAHGMMQGKGVYQFVDKYGANVDGYRWACSSAENRNMQQSIYI